MRTRSTPTASLFPSPTFVNSFVAATHLRTSALINFDSRPVSPTSSSASMDPSPAMTRRHPASLIPKSMHDPALLELVRSPVTPEMICTFPGRLAPSFPVVVADQTSSIVHSNLLCLLTRPNNSLHRSQDCRRDSNLLARRAAVTASHSHSYKVQHGP